MLGKYGLTVSETVLKQLEEAPLAWKQLKKKMFQRYSCLVISFKLLTKLNFVLRVLNHDIALPVEIER